LQVGQFGNKNAADNWHMHCRDIVAAVIVGLGSLLHSVLNTPLAAVRILLLFLHTKDIENIHMPMMMWSGLDMTAAVVDKGRQWPPLLLPLLLSSYAMLRTHYYIIKFTNS
jgi:hypothetical protein